MRWILKQKPVAALTTVLSILTAFDAFLAVTHMLPATGLAYIGLAETLITIVLGVLTHNAVTPVANPRAADGTPLVKRQ